jgi:hypothetical protein
LRCRGLAFFVLLGLLFVPRVPVALAATAKGQKKTAIPRERFGPLVSPGGEQQTLFLSQAWNSGPLCGPNALYILGQLEGRTFSLEELQSLTKVDREKGCTLNDLVNAAAALDFPVAARFVSDRELPQVDPPYVLHLAAAEEQPQMGHFVVIFAYRDSDRKFGVIDPGTGEYSYTTAQSLLRSYSGYILVPQTGIPLLLVIANCLLLGGALLFSIHGTFRSRKEAGENKAMRESGPSSVAPRGLAGESNIDHAANSD